MVLRFTRALSPVWNGIFAAFYCNLLLDPRTKNNKIQKETKKYYQKRYDSEKGCQNTQKMVKIGWGGLKI